MIYEKGRLSQLWQRLKGGSPRFINIHGEDWHKQTKLRFGASDVTACFYSAAAAGAAVALTTGFNNAAIVGAGVLIGSLYGTMFSRSIYKRSVLNPYLLAIEKFAIDTKGHAFPPPNIASLLHYTSELNTGSKIALSLIFITLGAASAVACATYGINNVSNAFSERANIITGKTNEPLTQILLSVTASAIWGLATQQLCVFRTTKKLLDGKYVFCAPPAPQTQTQESGVLNGIGQHSYAPIPVPVRR